VAVTVKVVLAVSTLGLAVRVTIALPVLSVVADVGVRVTTADVVVKVTVAPTFALPSAFRTVAVKFNVPPLEALMPAEMGVNDKGDPKFTFTVLLTVPVEAVTVTLPVVEGPVRVTLAVPPVVVALCEERVPSVVVKETVVPSATAAPLAFLTVAVIVTLPPTTGEVEDAVTVMDAGALGSVRGNQSTPQPASVTVSMAISQNTLCMTPPSKVGAGLSARV
jgi:hypothetical protein